MAQIGQIVDGKYKVLQLIGKGGMSRVYLGEDIRLKKKWAIKEIPKITGGKKNALFINAAVKEVQIIKSLDHPYIVRIIDVAEDIRSVYIIEDLVQGRSLRKAVQDEEILSESQLIKWALMICEVLIYLHERPVPVIYRDIKPENVILTPEGHIRLVDFGTARFYRPKSTADTTCLGTEKYAAPEQFEGHGAQTDARTDVFGLGKTMESLSDSCEKVSRDLEQLIAKASAPDPEDRYQTVREMYEDLKRLSAEAANIRRPGSVSLLRVLLIPAAVICIFMTAATVSIRAGSSQPLISKALDFAAGAISDGVFSTDEEEKLLNIIMPFLGELKEQEGFEELACEMGKLYWFYYTYGSDELTGRREAVNWFDLAAEDNDLAQAFSYIGKFKVSGSENISARENKEGYKEYFDHLSVLAEGISGEDISSEGLLETYGLVIDSIQKYADRFKREGISKDEAENLLGSASWNASKVAADSKELEVKKEKISEKVSAAMKTIKSVYKGSED